MEDIRRRVEYGNISIQLQAVERLYIEVKKKRPADATLSSSTPEYPELQLLWQLAGAPQVAVSQLSCHLLVQLCTDGVADFTYILNGFLNHVPSVKTLSGLVESVGRLLTLQIQLKVTAGEAYTCPYAIKSPPHPFITIVTNRPAESWPLLLDNVTSMLNNNQKWVRDNVLTMLDPFIKFILLDPKHTELYQSLRSELRLTLVTAVATATDRESKNRYFTYILDILLLQQVGSSEDVAMATQFCLHLLTLYGNHGDDIETEEGQRLARYALTLAWKNQEFGQSYVTLTSHIRKLGHKESEMVSQDMNLALLGSLLVTSTGQERIDLLYIVKEILRSGQSLSSTCVGFVVMANVNILSTTPTTSLATTHKLMTSLATDIVMATQEVFKQESNVKDRPFQSTAQLSPLAYNAQTCVHLAYLFSADHQKLDNWLTNLQSHLKRMKEVPECLQNLLVSLLITSDRTGTSKLAVDRLVDVVKQEPAKGPSLLPVFLYVLGRKSCPSLRLRLLEAIPQMATHKYNVSAVLKTIQSIAMVTQMKSLSIRLLTDLWVLQDRCFPHLLKVITEVKPSPSATMDAVTNDVILAKAHAIKEVCRLRPEQHGSDMLAPLSDLLNTCTDGRSAPAAALALEGLIYVCQAEVIDLISAWRVLEPSLTKETRSVVVVKICELLALVPSLEVKTEDYEVFVSETVRRLWLYSQTDEVDVVAAALHALGNFSVEHFKISHFRYKIVQDFIQQAEAMIETSKEGEEEREKMSVDEMIPNVPGVCYTRLLTDLSDHVLDGYESFLCKKVAVEVDNLPRGIYYTSLRQHGQPTNQGKALRSIPGNLQSQYEKTKHPGLRPELAAALLSCYNPDLETGRDGRPRKHYVMSHGKNFQQVFSAFLNDITVQPSNWHRLIALPQAWAAFVERLFSSMMEARKAEIDLQLNRGFVDEKEADDKKTVAWLWVRDTLVNVIKKSTKGSPSVQCNAILALAGLTTVIQRYVASLEAQERKQAEDVSEFKSQSHWVMTVIDSCMSLMDFTFKPKSSLIGLCQQRSEDDRLPASVLAQAAAIMALSQLVPLLLSNYLELVYIILGWLSERLPGQPISEDSPPVLQTFHGLGLGMFLARLVQERFSDLEGSKGSLAVMKTLDVLEESCFSSADNRTGVLLGLSQCLGALSQDGTTESRVHVTSLHGRLETMLKETDSRDQVFQPLCVCLAVMTGSSFSSNCLEVERADATFALLQQLLSEHSESYGLSLSVGLLSYSLRVTGHPNMATVSSSLVSGWRDRLSHTNTSTLAKLAALAGLVATVGSEKNLHMVDYSTVTDVCGPSIDSVASIVASLVSDSGEPAVAGNAAWLLGNLYLASCSTSQNKSAVPSTYSYLPETSILRAVVDFLIHAGKQGPESVSSCKVALCLKSIQREVTATLPPLNWTGVISPLMKMPFDDSVKHQCIQLAVKLCSSSTSATLFLSSWIVPPLFNTLTESCQMELLRSCDLFLKSVTPAVLQTFLDKSLKPTVTSDKKGRQLCVSALRGLNSALIVPDPPQAVTALLYATSRQMFTALDEATDPEVLLQLSECLSHLPDTVFDDITAADCTSAATIHRGLFVRCYLIAKGRQPLALLNSCLDAAFNIKCDQETVLYYLCQCFNQMNQTDTKLTRPPARLQWLLEIMGHVRNIAVGNVPLAPNVTNPSQVTSFAVVIIAAALSLWTSQEPAALLSLKADLLTSRDHNDDWLTKCNQDSDWSKSCHMTVQPEDLLTGQADNLCQEPWIQVVPKFLEWLLSMCGDQKVQMSADIRTKLGMSLASLRHSSDYSRMAIWTKAVLLV